MELQDFQNITNQIAQNLNNQALVTNLLTQLQDGFTTIHTTHETVTKQAQDYQREIKALQDTNMQLFLKVSNPVPPEVTKTSDPLKYEDVINQIQGAK